MLRHPWFEPLHRRILTTAICVGGVVFELSYEPGGIFLLIFLALTGYAVWGFFISGHYRVEDRADQADDQSRQAGRRDEIDDRAASGSQDDTEGHPNAQAPGSGQAGSERP